MQHAGSSSEKRPLLTPGSPPGQKRHRTPAETDHRRCFPSAASNSESVLFDRDAGFTASYMETLLMTEAGIEPLSERPRALTVVGA
jgi:hypothetical protein